MTSPRVDFPFQKPARSQMFPLLAQRASQNQNQVAWPHRHRGSSHRAHRRHQHQCRRLLRPHCLRRFHKGLARDLGPMWEASLARARSSEKRAQVPRVADQGKVAKPVQAWTRTWSGKMLRWLDPVGPTTTRGEDSGRQILKTIRRRLNLLRLSLQAPRNRVRKPSPSKTRSKYRMSNPSNSHRLPTAISAREASAQTYMLGPAVLRDPLPRTWASSLSSIQLRLQRPSTNDETRLRLLTCGEARHSEATLLSPPPP